MTNELGSNPSRKRASFGGGLSGLDLSLLESPSSSSSSVVLPFSIESLDDRDLPCPCCGLTVITSVSEN